MKILVKGILAHEDATLCVENGLDGLIVSNHARRRGQRRSTIDALPEIVEACAAESRTVDSGFRPLPARRRWATWPSASGSSAC